jgi:Bacteriocin-protection, YdeI or OmpD-Associated/Domain of unknown function (DUF1905)
MRFRTTIVASGKTAAGFEVPEEVMAALGAGRKPAVTVTVGSHTYRSTVATLDGRPMIGFSNDNRAKAGVAAGDEVDIDIELDTAPREVTVPDDLATALAADDAARATWEALSYSNKSWHVLSIEGAKAAETRQRRIDKSLAALRDGKPR